MLINLPSGKIVNVRIKHRQFAAGAEQEIGLGRKSIKAKAITTAKIRINESTYEHEGVAKCVVGDNFCKKTGRRFALTRALESADLSKGDREVVWERIERKQLTLSIRKTYKAEDGTEWIVFSEDGGEFAAIKVNGLDEKAVYKVTGFPIEACNFVAGYIVGPKLISEV